MRRQQKQGGEGVPVHWRRGRTAAGIAALLITAVAVWTLLPLGAAERLDAWWLKARFAAREKLRPATPDPDIVLVQIDDRTAEKWSDIPMAGWGARLAQAVDRLHASGARVIALDWTQPVDLEKWFPGNDQRLFQAFSTAGNVVMVTLWVPDGQGGGKWVPPTDVLLAGLQSNRDLGFAEVQVGDARTESVIAALTPVLPEGGDIQTSFSARIVERFRGADGKLDGRRWTFPDGKSVPLRDDGSYLVNYAPGTGTGAAFPRRSLADVAALPPAGDPALRDKIVIVGAAYKGSNDHHYIPVLEGRAGSRYAYGMEIQANAVRTLLDGKPVREPGDGALWAFSMLLALLGVLSFSRLSWLRALGAVAGAATAWIGASFAMFTSATFALPIAVPLAGLLLGGGLMATYRAAREELERRQVLGLWGRYQDPRLVQYLLEHPQARGGEGREAYVTVLFADLKNFTKTVESLAPTEALEMLNRYLALMSAVILEHGGYVDKYLGDGLMAQWGAPPPEGVSPDHSAVSYAQDAEAAVRACIELDRRTRELTASLSDGRDVTFGLRLTLHSGPVVVGWVGSSRLEFTIIGDTVNVTSRLQETAKELGCELLVSESTYGHVRGWVETGQEAEVAIRGRKQPLRVYEITGERDVSHTPAAGELVSS